MSHATPVAGLIIVTLVLGGCGGNPTCEPLSESRDTGSVPDIRIPAGMSEPDRSEALRIPVSARTGEQAGEIGHCLDAPPKFYERPGAVAGSPEALIYNWADAWNQKDTDRMFRFYAPDFVPPEGDLEDWRAARVRQLTDPAPVRVSIESLFLAPAPGGRMQAQFVQRFESSNDNFALSREMVLIRVDNVWYIAEERVTDVL